MRGSINTSQQVTVTYGAPTDQLGKPAVVSAIAWMTSNAALATVDPAGQYAGLVKGKGVGTCEVWIQGQDTKGKLVEGEHVTMDITAYAKPLIVKFGAPTLGVPEDQPTQPTQPPTTLTGRFVDPRGSDTNNGTEAHPFQTVTKGLSVLGPGENFLYVRNGIYPENITWAPTGTAASRIRVKNYPGEKPWIAPTVKIDGSNVFWLDCDCAFVDFDGINIDGRPSRQTCVWFSTNNGKQPHHMRVMNAEMIAGETGGGAALMTGSHSFPGQIGYQEFINLQISGGGLPGECGWQCASYGVYINSPNNLVDRCVIVDPCGAGIQLYSKLGEANNNIIRNTIIREISRAGDPGQVWGIICTGADNQMYNNLIHDISKVGTSGNGDAAISITNRGNKVWHNTIYRVVNAGIYVGVDSGGNPARETVLQNNLVFRAAMAPYADGGSTGTVENHNLWNVDPLFVNTGAGPYDFHLQAGSPAKNAGIVIPEVTTDFEGTLRPPPPSMGAYE